MAIRRTTPPATPATAATGKLIHFVSTGLRTGCAGTHGDLLVLELASGGGLEDVVEEPGAV